MRSRSTLAVGPHVTPTTLLPRLTISFRSGWPGSWTIECRFGEADAENRDEAESKSADRTRRLYMPSLQQHRRDSPGKLSCGGMPGIKGTHADTFYDSNQLQYLETISYAICKDAVCI